MAWFAETCFPNRFKRHSRQEVNKEVITQVLLCDHLWIRNLVTRAALIIWSQETNCNVDHVDDVDDLLNRTQRLLCQEVLNVLKWELEWCNKAVVDCEYHHEELPSKKVICIRGTTLSSLCTAFPKELTALDWDYIPSMSCLVSVLSCVFCM